MDKKQVIENLFHTSKAIGRELIQITMLKGHPKTKETLQTALNEKLDGVANTIDAWIDERVELYLKGAKKKGRKKVDHPDIF